ncbi:MAG: AI-2 transport protein TqsA [Oleispira sp.]|jgi:predicted PurR-regulated permease PerM
MNKPLVTHNVMINFAAFIIVVAGLKAATQLLVPFLLAVFIAVLCAPMMIWLKKKRMPSTVSVLLVAVLFFLITATLGTIIGSSLSAFYQDLPEYEQKLQQQGAGILATLRGFGIDVDETVFSSYIDPGAAIKMVGTIFSGLGGVLTNAFLILFTVVFILLEASDFPEKFRRALGSKTNALDYFQNFSGSVQRYLLIKTLVSMGTGMFVGIMLAWIGVDYAILWAVIAFLLNFIPNIGSIIAAVPPMLIALIQLGPMSSLLVAGLYVVTNVVFGNVIEPRFMGRSLGLSTLVVFVSLIFWGWIFGPVGMLLSIPLTIMVKIGLENSEKNRWLAVLLGH